MDESTLDFRFGWRWLLPISTCRSFHLVGFSSEENSYWENLLHFSGQIGDRQSAELFIIKDDGCDDDLNPNSFDFSEARFIALVGQKAQVSPWRKTLRESFPQVREYCLLPSENPRVVVPLSSSIATKRSLNLHRPGRWFARLGVQAASIMAGFGIYTLLRRHILLTASHYPDSHMKDRLFPAYSKRSPSSEIDYTLYLGTPNGNRKTVVLPLTIEEPVSILKIAETSEARCYLSNEARVLEKLTNSLVSSFIPKSGGLVEAEGALNFYQEYRPRKPVAARRMEFEVTKFLGLLSRIERRPLPLSDISCELTGANGLETKTAKAYCILLDRLKAHAQMGQEVFHHRAHGDFAPWNCAWTRQGLFVFDWEESRAGELAFSDAFYYTVAPALHIKRKPNPRRIVRSSLRLAKKVADAGGLEGIDVMSYLAIWLIQRTNKAPLYKEMMQALSKDWK